MRKVGGCRVIEKEWNGFELKTVCWLEQVNEDVVNNAGEGARGRRKRG